MKHNLFTPMTGKLNYPHHTKFEKGVLHLVTHPDKLIKADDVVFCEGENRETIGKRKVLEVLEQRTARGAHSVDFIPVFQKLRTSMV